MKAFLLGHPSHDSSTDLGLLGLRVVAGLALATLHGIGKLPPPDWYLGLVSGMGMPVPEFFAWLGMVAELVGGLLLAVGLLTRPAAILVLGHFAVVIAFAHAGDPLADREPAMLFAAIAFLLLLAGPGRYSLDAAFFKRR